MAVAQSPLIHDAGLEAFDDHIGLGRQPAKGILRFGLVEIEGDVVLVPALHQVAKSSPLVEVAKGGELSSRVSSGRLDPDHVGAELREDGRREKSSDAALAHIQDEQVVEGFRLQMVLPGIVRFTDPVDPGAIRFDREIFVWQGGLNLGNFHGLLLLSKCFGSISGPIT